MRQEKYFDIKLLSLIGSEKAANLFFCRENYFLCRETIFCVGIITKERILAKTGSFSGQMVVSNSFTMNCLKINALRTTNKCLSSMLLLFKECFVVRV